MTQTVKQHRLPVLLLAVVALAASLLAAQPASPACAHDLSGMCLDVELGPGDTIDKGGYDHDGTRVARDHAGRGHSPSRNVRLLGHLETEQSFNADVVAHKGTAYLGSWGTPGAGGAFCPSLGVRAIDLGNGRNPTLIDTFADGAGEPDLQGSWTEKVIVESVNTPDFRGDLAAVSFQACVNGSFRGFGLYDVSDPGNVERLGLVEVPSGSFVYGSHELWLEVLDGVPYVYTAIINSEFTTRTMVDGQEVPGTPDFQVWDVSDPTEAVKVGEWGAWAELGLRPVRTEDGVARSGFVHSVIGDGKGRVFLSYWDNGTIILDLDDPSDPRFVGRTSFEAFEEGNAHSAWLAQGGNVMIQTHEDFSPTSPPGSPVEEAWGYTKIYDIKDPSEPRLLSTFELPSTRGTPPGPGDYTVHDPKVRGSTLYLSYYAEGVVMVDISRPASPRQFAQFVPPAAPDSFGFFPEAPNVWGVDLERNLVVASDMNSGLWVFQVTGR